MKSKKKRDLSGMPELLLRPHTGALPDESSVQAVIFMGASALSMMVAEISNGEQRVLDVLSQPIALAQDVFSCSRVSRDTMDRAVEILRGYNDLLEEYRLAGEVQVRLLASNILLNIRNMDTLVNRIQIGCGLHLEVMDDGDMTRLLYLNVQALVKAHPEILRKRTVVLHVGPGNTRVLVLDKGRIIHYANYRMGAHRTGVTIGDPEFGAPENEDALIREHIRGIVEQIHYDSEGALEASPAALVLFGPDFRQPVTPLFEQKYVTVDGLKRLAEQIAETPPAQRVARFHEDYASLCSLLPMVNIYLSVAREFSPKTIICPVEEYANAFLRDLMPSRLDNLALEEEVIHFTSLLARRYRVDVGHSEHITRLSMALFDELQELHGLTHRDRLLLKVASILHEIGGYISPKGHHRHSQYIILNSEIFGLSRLDIEVVGLLARYHRHGAPSEKDHSYMELDLANRLRVQKLAALLRVAEAMERAHSRRITAFSIRFNNRRLELLVPDANDLTLENMALRTKGALFTDVFGYDIMLLPARG